MPYLTVTVRVPSLTAAQCRTLAQEFGWQLADFLRTLICVGTAVLFLAGTSPDAEQAANVLLGGLKLVKVSRSFSMRLRERPYSVRIPGRESTLLTLTLPASMCDFVATYASTREASRNQAYYKLLQQGLITFMKALASVTEMSTYGKISKSARS
jgi:hypothetical protein